MNSTLKDTHASQELFLLPFRHSPKHDAPILEQEHVRDPFVFKVIILFPLTIRHPIRAGVFGR